MTMETQNNFKLGLALSGGGFRSALFHVGVLSRLAELDLLRKIDVISSVSGGSIIAAYYYLKVKSLLEKRSAADQTAPTRETYIRMMKEIETDFLSVVQKNMLMRIFLDPGKNARMMGPDYSNTERFAELLTTYFFRPVLQQQGEMLKKDQIVLKDISIKPGVDHDYSETKIPFLIINATSLNTGHLWQFTSTSMGEQRTEIKTGQDSTSFLKKIQINDERLTIEQRKILYNITLGQAVAASSCVPGIFEPLEIRNLYKSARNPLTVRLVDGGLVDNQGLASLFAEGCTHIICSDASDILKQEHHPSTQFLNVALRANDILMARVRSKSLNELFQFEPTRYALFDMGDHETRNLIFPDDSEKIVSSLTRIRTNLDSFSDIEADTLMYYGYQLCRNVLQDKGFELISDPIPSTRNWRFFEIRDLFLTNEARRKDLIFHLEVGSRQMFKVFLLKKAKPYLILLPFPVLMILLTLYLVIRLSPMVFWILVICCVLVLIYTQNIRILELMDNIEVFKKIKQRILKILISLKLPEPFSYIIALLSWIQLKVFDRLFLRYGRVRDNETKSAFRLGRK